MALQKLCPHKILDEQKAVSIIKPGSRVFIGTGCGEPRHLVQAMINDLSLRDIVVYQMIAYSLSGCMDNESFLDRFKLKVFFITGSMRKAVFEGKVDYIPVYLSRIPSLLATHSIGLDVALVQVSPPDTYGYCSLGISVDITRSAMEHANVVIAQVNSAMPRTYGDSLVHVDEIDFMVPFNEPLTEVLLTTRDNEVERRIGFYVSQLVEDGATLQFGFGNLPNAILPYLSHKKDLGIHTQMITDSLLPLFEKKVITNKKKTLLPGRSVASICMGSERLYRYVDNNPIFYFRSSEFVNDPLQIARNDNMISIGSALEVDITGQVCMDSMGSLFYSGIGNQVDFIRGCAMSKGGVSIIILPATAQNGRVSRIVSHLNKGAGVATTRGDVNFVVTEYGIAELSGKSIFQRVMELAQIAHPKFREELIEIAKKRHYIFSDQLPPSQDDLIFLEGYKSTLELNNGRSIEFRPLLASDEFAFRNFYYSLQIKSVYFRFFRKMRVFSHEVVQKQWAHLDYRKNMSLIGLVHRGGHKEIMAIASYTQAEKNYAEAAFVVREDFQNMGITSYLIGKLENIAIENGYIGFSATVLSENSAMLHVFRKRYPKAEMNLTGGEIVLRMTFPTPFLPIEKGYQGHPE